MNASTGIVLDDSEIVNRMAKVNEDDVARARQTVSDNGVVSSVPGITSCIFTKWSENQGECQFLRSF